MCPYTKYYSQYFCQQRLPAMGLKISHVFCIVVVAVDVVVFFFILMFIISSCHINVKSMDSFAT